MGLGFPVVRVLCYTAGVAGGGAAVGGARAPCEVTGVCAAVRVCADALTLLLTLRKDFVLLFAYGL